MSQIGFMTPITFRDPPHSIAEYLLEKADAYFYLGGEKVILWLH